MLPEPNDRNALTPKCTRDQYIALAIPVKLFFPEPPSRCRHRSMKRAPVPEASVHEYSNLQMREKEVGRALDFVVSPPARNPRLA